MSNQETRTCEHCGELIQGKGKRYCSFTCYRQARRAGFGTRVCKSCGERFVSTREGQWYCCGECFFRRARFDYDKPEDAEGRLKEIARLERKNKITTAERLEAAMLKADIWVGELADRSGIGPHRIRRYLAGTQTPTRATAERLDEVLGSELRFRTKRCVADKLDRTRRAGATGYRLNQALRLARLEAGLTLKELAEKSGVCSQTISNTEAGRTIPHAFTLQCLCEVLGVDLLPLRGFALAHTAGHKARLSVHRRNGHAYLSVGGRDEALQLSHEEADALLAALRTSAHRRRVLVEEVSHG